MEKKNIIIIGAGWYGCHIATQLKNIFNVTIIEKNNSIFDNASYYNQNRLHLGFHYSRNYKTRQLCKNNFNNFIKKYAFCVEIIPNNYYVISKNSIIDYKSYMHIYKYEDYDFNIEDNKYFINIDGDIIKTNEMVINSDIIKKHFEDELKNINLILNTTVTKMIKKDNKIIINTNKENYECDILLDCTFNQLELSKKNYKYELTISLVFKKINLNLFFDALTMMDGPFFSIYPRDLTNNLYTLTDVEHTPVFSSNNYKDIDTYILSEEKINEIKDKMINKVEIYYSSFQTDFEYQSFFLSKKTKNLSNSDSRDINIEILEDNIITVNCGKIYGIFEFENFIMKYLNVNL